MNSLIYILRFLFRIRYWFILPVIATLIAVAITKPSRNKHTYEVSTTIYTGVVSGYDIESGQNERQDWNVINNAMDNLINIIMAQTTLKKVSMRLYAQDLMYGDPNKDNNYISASSYRTLISKTPKDVLALVDKSSEQKTLDNLNAYEKASRNNHLYGLFNYTHPHYSYEALKKITVKRLGSSDMLEIKYSADDPGIAYNTLMILNDEFVDQYKVLRFGETNNVIKYFEEELARVGRLLRIAEDSLTDYNVDKKVINYDEQTKHIAALSRDYELTYEGILLNYNSSERLLKTLENRIEEHVRQLKNNQLFIDKLNTISDLTARIATVNSFQTDSLSRAPSVDVWERQLNQAEKELGDLTHQLGVQQYTKEGLSTSAIVDQWLSELIRFEKSKAELNVMKERKIELEQQYVHFSPIGSTIKRKEREINFNENSYLSILNSLNNARLKQKSLQMTSATLKVINPPIFPISSMPTKRKLVVAGVFFGSLLFLIGYFILLELLDRTLRDKIRTERVTGGKVLGAFPAPSRMRYRSYNRACQEIAAHFMGNALLGFFKPAKPNIVNLLSTEKGTGKSFLAEQLKTYWENSGLNVRYVSWEKDFSIDRKEFLLAQRLSDFCQTGNEDVVIVEYPAFKESSVPKGLLDEASVNLVVASARHVWQDIDQLLFDKAVEQTGETPLFIYLNEARRDAVETFTGMLPPYTRLRELSYKIYQFGFTAR